MKPIMKNHLLCLLAAVGVVFLGGCKKSESSGKKSSLTFSQDQEFNLTFEAEATSQNIFFTADGIWMVQDENGLEADKRWYSVTPTHGAGGETFVELSIPENTDMDKDRTAVFSIICGADKQLFTILQYSRNSAESKHVYFADEKFKSYCVENFDTDGDGRISKEEAAAITEIDCQEREITSLEGIKYMTALTTLNCRYNSIDGSLDLSGLKNLKTVNADHNFYSRLDLSGCSALETLVANDNYGYNEQSKMVFTLAEVDLTGCAALKKVSLQDNAITTLSLKDSPELEEINMSMNQLQSIDLSKCAKLKIVHIRSNNFNSAVDLSHCPELTYLGAWEANLTGLNVSGCNKLVQLIAYRNTGLKSIDVSSCSALTELNLYETGITAVDVRNNVNLVKLNLGFTGGLTDIDLSANSKLTELNLQENKLTSLDVSSCKALTTLKAENNSLTSVNLAGCSALTKLYLYNNKLTSVDLTSCKSLGSLAIYTNSLTSLDVTPCAAEMYFLDCKENAIKELKVNGLSKLGTLDASTNAISSLDLTSCKALEEVLLSKNQLAELKVKGLDKMSVCEFQNNKLKRLDLRGCVAIDELHISDNADLAYVSFYGCTALRYVDCRRTSVSTLDFSGNEKMNFLFATECPLLKTIYIRPGANYSSLGFDEATTKVFEKDPESYSDVKTDNWGDEDIDPWGK